MATSAQAGRVPGGVAPLRAGQGNSFFWRRLHSLSGIVPVGAFLVEHFVSNAFATNGPVAYSQQVKFLSGLPFRLWLEIFGIFIPLAFHGLYGVWIWWRGENNVRDYPWAGNWMYTLQRYTGLIALVYIVTHTWEMRFSGVELVHFNDAAFYKVQHELSEIGDLIWYIVGVTAASWHFGYGIFLFCAKWGIVSGERARKRMQVAGVAISVLFMVLGYATMWAILNPKPDWQKHTIREWENTQNPPVLDHEKH